MKHTLVKTMGILSIVLLSCTLICGVWISSHPDSDMAFHAGLSGASVVAAMITIIVNMNKCKVCHKAKIK